MAIKPDKPHKLHLEKEKETLLITLYAKALDSLSKKPVLNDKKAAEILEMIDYNFNKLNNFGNGNIMVVRAKQFDAWVNAFLECNSDATVLNIGCGLDTRVSRINPRSKVSWYDIDYPEVIKVRKLFYSEHDGYEMVESSVNEPEWIEKIPADKPVMIVAEGILEYLTEEEVKTLFGRLTDHFPHGQISFDVMNSFAINSGKESLKETTGAVHKWAVDSIDDVDKLNGRLERMEAISVFGSKYMTKLSLKYRLVYTAMSVVPNFRNMIRLLQYRF